MEYAGILRGAGEDLPVFTPIIRALENLDEFPFLLEPIYRDSMGLAENDIDRLRFALLRLQMYADIHRYEDMEKAQKTKYVAQILERVIFGGLLLEGEESAEKCSCST